MKALRTILCKAMRLQKTYAKSVWLKAKGKGKSGGARVITFNVFTDVENGHVVFLLLYDKEDASTVKVNVVKQLVRDMGFDIE